MVCQFILTWHAGLVVVTTEEKKHERAADHTSKLQLVKPIVTNCYSVVGNISDFLDEIVRKNDKE